MGSHLIAIRRGDVLSLLDDLNGRHLLAGVHRPYNLLQPHVPNPAAPHARQLEGLYTAQLELHRMHHPTGTASSTLHDQGCRSLSVG